MHFKTLCNDKIAFRQRGHILSVRTSDSTAGFPLCSFRAHFRSPRRHIWRHQTAGTPLAALHFLGTPQKSSKALKWDFEIRLHVNAVRLLPFAFSQIPGFYPSEDASLVEHPLCFATPPTSLKLSQ